MKLCYRLILALALCLLLTSSYAIRIQRDPNPVETQVKIDEKTTRNMASKDSEDCSSTSSGNSRKLIISSKSSPSTAPTTSSKSLDEGENIKVDHMVVKKSNHDANSVRKDEPSGPSSRSEDVEYGDMTEMDYSPAKRKTPIHN